jgi:RNA polymerase sigma factor (sigma-70 family)
MTGFRMRTFDDPSLRVLLRDGSMIGWSDAELVRGFLGDRSEASEQAFAALVERHGPMVLGVCRRILRDEHAAEDAFQAVFLLLARKARSVNVDDSLGRWLHGVTRRVAVRARVLARREIPAPVALEDRSFDPAVAAARAEIRELVGLEITRLPRKYREAVALFHLDGLSHDGAAEALGLPVGTIRSRLSRARDLLRARLVRRGLAPAALTSWLTSRTDAAALPRALFESTVKHALRTSVATIPTSIALLVDYTLTTLSIAKAIKAGALLIAIGCVATGGLAAVRGGDERQNPRPSAATVPSAEKAVPPAAATSLAEQFRKIVKEFDDRKEFANKQAEQGKTAFEKWKIRGAKSPDETSYARRVVDLAATNPRDPASRDGLIWVINKPYRDDSGRFGDEVQRAVNLLVTHHADDPEVARLGLGLDNLVTRRRDAFLEGIYANAEGTEAKGLARMALAQYLQKKALEVAAVHRYKQRSVARYQTYDDHGDLVEKTSRLSNEEEGYRIHERMLDPEKVRLEAERLYEEVIAEYGKIPYISTRYRELERLARERPSASCTLPSERKEMREIEEYLRDEKPQTLSAVAAARLDDMRNLAVGKPAPDFAGVGVDGKPLKLSDFRGKVVALVYWFSTCGPCLQEIPHERELTQKMKGRPFTLLGVVTDGRAEEARKVIEAEGMAWPNVLNGGDKIAEQYHVQSNPSYFVIDAKGVIRSKGYALPSALDALVEKLVTETEAGPRLDPTRH